MMVMEFLSQKIPDNKRFNFSCFKRLPKRNDTNGIDIYTVKGWDYAGMCEVFEAGLDKVRQTHIPAVFHVEEITQPQGHSTSGSHERYKDAERLQWERDWDCIKKMKEWIIENNIATTDEIEVIEEGAKETVKQSRRLAWEEYVNAIKEEVSKAVEVIKSTIVNDIERYNEIQKIAKDLEKNRDVLRRDIMHALSMAIHAAGKAAFADDLINYYNEQKNYYKSVYNSHLYNQGISSAIHVEGVEPVFAADAPVINGYEIINRYFDKLFTHNKKVVAFGEDVGFIGDVNQGFAGLQDKHGEYRIFDTGIRELTIMGQGIGLALRGLRPIAEIQYLDYLVYGLQPLTDDVATLQYRTKGVQHCPLIVRSRGHRLEGIWHSGSPMGMIINSLRGMHVCVPRNMVQAVAMYNTILKSNDPAIIIECLNGYRLKGEITF
jgi:hypothetical protein